MANLYIVSTPIGNLKDLTLRALEILAQVPVIACEDTRKTSQLLTHFNIKKNQELISFFEGNENARIPQIISKLLAGKDVALVSNSGTPTISDPGFKLVRAATQAGIKVVPIPGASAALAALVASGLPTDKFLFLGFLPKKPSHRKKFLKDNIKPNLTTIIYLSPHRILPELKDLQETTGDIEVVVCRELTKVFEEIKREKISKLIDFFEKNKPKGEYTLIFNFQIPIKN